MLHVRIGVLALSALVSPAIAGSALAQSVVEEFVSDPTLLHNGVQFDVRGGDTGQFRWLQFTPVRYEGDQGGALRVTYDSTLPTSRLFTPIGGGFTQDDDFLFGAVLTIQPDGFAPDPYGFHPIAFSLFNATTTGNDRTGDLLDFASDTFDTVEMAYFPNVSPFFGGPFLSPSAFGVAVGNDAFANFGFGSIPFPLQPGVTYLIELEYTAATRTLTAQVSRVRRDAMAIPVPGGRVTANLSSLSGFLVNSLAVSAYFDGFNAFAASGRSLYAVVDYDLLYVGPRTGSANLPAVQQALSRFARPGRVAVRQPALR